MLFKKDEWETEISLIPWQILMFAGAISLKVAIEGFLIMIVIFSIIYFLSWKFTWIKIENKKLTISFDSFWSKTIDIYSITEIDRIASNKVKYWGSSMIFRYVDKEGKKKEKKIMETYFKSETFKKVIKELLKINKNIKVNHQYQDLINGKYDNEFEKFKKVIPDR